ncbi:MAG: hypothetical protein AYK23_04970 [Candidatus Proteinoplasmatales archaeon SG8-5]|nr:MAG: hypothetical protein AYK23_04970 [Candidatus Proteinoplasmatales archaeon SG8-5]
MGAIDIAIGPLDEYLGESDVDVDAVLALAESILMVCGVIFIIFSILALLGGIMAITRKSWGFAVVGAIFGLLTIGPYGLGFVLGLVALILIIISKDEF